MKDRPGGRVADQECEALAAWGCSVRSEQAKTDHMEDAVLEGSSTRLAKDCSMRAERQLHTMIVRLSGEFDLACEERFQDELGRVLDGHTGTLLLDLRDLDFIDSTGLRVLVQTDELARSDGVDFTILCRDGQVRDVLRVSGLDGYLPVVDPWGTVPDSDSPV